MVVVVMVVVVAVEWKRLGTVKSVLAARYFEMLLLSL
jgi:hypothetical protein